MSVSAILATCAGLCFFFMLFVAGMAFLRERKMVEAHRVALEKQNAVLLVEKKQLEQYHTQLKCELEHYAQTVVAQKTLLLEEETQKNISALLVPLKEKLGEFQKKVEHIYHQESRELFSLKNEVHRLLTTNADMMSATQHLTRALKGDIKAQGAWGEVILEQVLTRSGLREGQEYMLQGKGQQLRDREGKLAKPDVVIVLPHGKHIIIDAKISLLHYAQAIETEDPEIKTQKMQLFVQSLEQHVHSLSGKQYQYLEQLTSPDFVILFFPIEGAFSLAVEQVPELLTSAWDQKIVIAGPSTLLATLKTIASVWLFEKQNKYSIRIAQEAGLLYDKLVLFTQDLEKIGLCLKKAEHAYDDAMQKLMHGRGNVLSKAEKMKALGAKAKRSLDLSQVSMDEILETESG
jgi:DNA recombination protein RmuC